MNHRQFHEADELVAAVHRAQGWKPMSVVAMATKFGLPNGIVTHLMGITLPAFFARPPEEFLATVAESRVDRTKGGKR